MSQHHSNNLFLLTLSFETSLFENPFIKFKVGFEEGVEDLKQFVSNSLQNSKIGFHFVILICFFQTLKMLL